MNYNIIIGIFLISLVVLKVNNKIDISGTVLGIITIITVLMLKSKNNLEFLKTNDEVLAYIGSVLDSGNMTVTNLKVTGKLDVDGAATITGKLTAPEGTITKLHSDIHYLGLTDKGGTIDCGYNKLTIGGNVKVSGMLQADGKITSSDHIYATNWIESPGSIKAGTSMTYGGKKVITDGAKIRITDPTGRYLAQSTSSGPSCTSCSDAKYTAWNKTDNIQLLNIYT